MKQAFSLRAANQGLYVHSFWKQLITLSVILRALNTNLPQPSYLIFSKSLAKPGKKKNGDFYKTVDASDYVLALVADGISSTPCDWKASKTACENLGIYVAEHFSHNSDIKKLLSEALVQVNKDLLGEAGECDGLGTTICGALWMKGSDLISYFSLGDSRIYFYRKNKLLQISSDDSLTSVSTKNLRPGDQVFSRSLITNHLGRSNYQISIKEHSFEAGDGIILATDGFIESTASFEAEITNSINQIDFEKPVTHLFEKNRIDQRDDATLTLMRRAYPRPDSSDISEFLSGLRPGQDVFQESDMVFHMLVSGIKDQNDKVCLAATRRIEERNLKLGKQRLLSLLDQVIESSYKGAGLYNTLVLLISKSD